MTLGERLRHFGTAKFGSVKDFAAAISMPPSNLQLYLNDERKPGSEILKRVAALGCDLNWLITGIGEEQSVANTVKHDSDSYQLTAPHPFENTVSFGNNLHRFPLVSYLGAGSVTPHDNEVSEWVVFEFPETDCIALRVVGDSMAPRIENGDIVLISNKTKPVPGDIVAIRTNTGEQFIKRFLAVDKKNITLLSENAASNAIISIEKKQLQTVRKVVFCHKSFTKSGIDYGNKN